MTEPTAATPGKIAGLGAKLFGGGIPMPGMMSKAPMKPATIPLPDVGPQETPKLEHATKSRPKLMNRGAPSRRKLQCPPGASAVPKKYDVGTMSPGLKAFVTKHDTLWKPIANHGLITKFEACASSENIPSWLETCLIQRFLLWPELSKLMGLTLAKAPEGEIMLQFATTISMLQTRESDFFRTFQRALLSHQSEKKWLVTRGMGDFLVRAGHELSFEGCMSVLLAYFVPTFQLVMSHAESCGTAATSTAPSWTHALTNCRDLVNFLGDNFLSAKLDSTTENAIATMLRYQQAWMDVALSSVPAA